MQLLVGGSRTVNIDPIKDAFSLLVEPNTMQDKIKSSLNDQEKDFMDLLINHTTIMTGFTYLVTDEEEERGVFHLNIFFSFKLFTFFGKKSYNRTIF
jgi:short-subunit dehydrogenase